MNIFNFKTKKRNSGRNPDFKCSICGKYTSYDRRTVIVTYRTEAKFCSYEEQWFPEEIIEFTHKKCLNSLKNHL